MNLILKRCVCLLLTLALLSGLTQPGLAASSADFSDVPEDSWYTEAVRYTVERGMLRGVAEGLFGPKRAMDRAMLVTVLWRMAGAPASAGELPFKDLSEDGYYLDALRWAVSNHLTAGVDATHFGPHRKVTREQLAAMLYRYAALLGRAESGQVNLKTYPDGGNASAYARDPLRWAISNRLLQGALSEGINYLRPRKDTTRAEAAVILMGFHRHMVLGEPQAPARPPQEAPQPKSKLTLWIEGEKAENCPVWDGTAYCSLRELARIGAGSLAEGGNLWLQAWGSSIYLQENGAALLLKGRKQALSNPTRLWEGSWYVPAELLQRLGMDKLEDPENLQSFFMRLPRHEQVPTGRKLVILRYHCVSDDIWGSEGLFMSPEKVEAQISAMEELGCSFLTFEDLPQLDQYEKPVLLTFDDGYRDNYTELFPILKRHNAKATIFMVTRLIGSGKYLTEAQIREMDASGLVSFQSHTVSHADMSALSEEEQRYQLSESRLAIARLTGKIPFALSYPKAKASAEALALVSEYYLYSVLRDGFPYETGTDPYRIPRFVMPRDLTMETFLTYFDCFT